MANCCLKKFASIVILGSALSFSAMQAKVQADSMKNITMPQKVTNISQNDMNMLFNNVDSSKVAKLDSVEMSETRGEFLDALLTSIGIGIVIWGLSCVLNSVCNSITFGGSF